MVVETLKCNEVCGENHVEYTYKLIQRELSMDIEGGRRVIEAYGIEVESKIKDNNGSGQVFKDEVQYITPYKNKGHEFLNMLKNNSVSPIHLIDIVEEHIEEYYMDFNDIAEAIAN